MRKGIIYRIAFCLLAVLLPVADGTTAEEPPPVVVGPPPEEKPWDASIALGINVTSGNSDTTLLSLSCRAQKEWATDIWALGSDLAYGENSADKSNEKAGAFADYKRLLKHRLYASLHLDLLHDAVANLEWRATVGPSLGYYFIKSERTQLNAEAGPSFVIEKTDVEHPNQLPPPDHVPPPESAFVTSETREYAVLRFAERFEHQLNAKARIWQAVEFLPQVDDFGNFLVNAEVGVEAALNSRLSLRTVAQDKYDNEPAPGSESNDISLISSLVYKFH